VSVKLTQRAMIQHLLVTPDAGGGEARVWADFRYVWANVRWGKVSRDAENGEIGLRQRALVTVRWAPDLPDPMRLNLAGKTLKVLAAMRRKIDAGDYFELECEDTF